DRLQPTDIVDAGRAHTGGTFYQAVVQQAHHQGTRVPAARDQSAVDGILRGLFVGVKRLRIVAASELDDFFARHGAHSEFNLLPDGKILPIYLAAHPPLPLNLRARL